MDIPDFSPARVLVVGDVMLDQYWHGSSRRISPEAPVPIVHVRNDELRAGGASNVAINITALGGSAHLLGLTGDDENARKLQTLLQGMGVSSHFQRCVGKDTIVKLRVIAQHQQMIRLDFEDQFEQLDKGEMLAMLEREIEHFEVLVLSDYAKGTLSSIADLIKIANQYAKPVIIDPKGGDFAKYRGASLLTPNRSEFEAIVGPCADDADLVSKGERLRAELDLGALLVTRGEEGMTLIQGELAPFHLPTAAREVFDVTGAGDTVIGTLAAALAIGADLRKAVCLANLAAGIVVAKLGTATASAAQMRAALSQADDLAGGVVEQQRLLELLDRARAKGERIVMTNGCFDLLHVGHIDYLQKARALGDRLVVAVNSDASVRRLKGSQRPINPLADRMTMLAALGCVDWVVPFEEDTPQELYCRVLPDILVKGGDYRADQVAGGDCVTANGGRVEILSFVEGHSTSSTIERIRS